MRMPETVLHSIYYRFPTDFPLPFILDGATGTALMKLGMPEGVPPEKWVLKNPEAIKSIQIGYIKSGSDAIYSPTFGANSAVLNRHNPPEKQMTAGSVAEINSALLTLSKEALSSASCHYGNCKIVDNCKIVGNCRIVGNMSPTGLMIEPYGDTPFDTVAEIYAEQASALVNAGANLICIETGISLQECRAAVIGTKSVCDLPIFVTLTFDSGGRTMSGDTIEAALLTLANLGVCAVGANCSSGPADMLKILAPAAKYAVALGIPLIAKPNAGMPLTDEDGNVYFDLPAGEFAKHAAEFLNSGIFILGGCCGTDEKYISLLRETVDNFAFNKDAEYLKKAQNITPDTLVSTNREILDLRFVKNISQTIKTDNNFADNIDMAVENGAQLLDIFVSEGGAKIFAENEFLLSVPLILHGDLAEIEKIRRKYNGHFATK